MLNFLISHFNLTMLIVWIAFYVIVITRMLRPQWVKNISYQRLIVGAVSIHLLYGVTATILQYLLYTKTEVGKVLVSIALPKEVPFPSLLEWTRPLFAHAHGYFAFFSFQHFFLNVIALFVVTGLFTLFFKMYKKERPELFREGDIAIITIAFLVAGWYGAIVLAPLSLAIAIVFVLARMIFRTASHVHLAPVFIAAAPFAFVFAIPLLRAVSLYPLLKL